MNAEAEILGWWNSLAEVLGLEGSEEQKCHRIGELIHITPDEVKRILRRAKEGTCGTN